MTEQPKAISEEDLLKLIDARISKLHSPQPAPQKEKAEPEKQVHAMRSWEKRCTNCGENNPEYKKPNVFCSKCGVPMGNAPEETEEGASLDLPPCWNCDSTEVTVKKEQEEEE